jgi:hypothetical protein
MMNDDDVLCAVRDRLHEARESLGDVRMERPPSSILDRARHRRLRRGLTGGGTAAAALGITVALVLGQPTARPVHVNLDAWSVNTNPGGTVTVTLRELRDPAVLRRVLAQAGIPAVVNFGKFCVPVTSGAVVRTPVPRPGSPDSGSDAVMTPQTRMGEGVLTFNPAALPKGTELDLGVASAIGGPGAGKGFSVTAGVVRRGVPLVCHTPALHIPPDPYHSK